MQSCVSRVSLTRSTGPAHGGPVLLVKRPQSRVLTGCCRHWSPQLGLRGQVAWEKLAIPRRHIYMCVCVHMMSSRVLEYWQPVASSLYHPASTCRRFDSQSVRTVCVLLFPGRTHSADAVAGTQAADKGASALQHGIDAGLRGIELIPDGLAHSRHVRQQHHRQQAGDVHWHTGDRARTLPEEAISNFEFTNLQKPICLLCMNPQQYRLC